MGLPVGCRLSLDTKSAGSRLTSMLNCTRYFLPGDHIIPQPSLLSTHPHIIRHTFTISMLFEQ